MTQPVPDPAVLPVFTATNLPGHAANPDTDAVIKWPVSPGGTEYMPMSGQFIVAGQECTDGFLTVAADGSPVWSAKAPA